MKRIRNLFMSLSIILIVSSCQKNEEQIVTSQVVEDFEIIEGINPAEIFESIASQSGKSTIIIDLSYIKKDWILTMVEKKIYDENSSFQQIRGNEVMDINLPKMYFLVGKHSSSGKVLAVSDEENFSMQYLDKDGQTLHIVEPSARIIEDQNKNYVLYTNKDLKLTDEHSCPVEPVTPDNLFSTNGKEDSKNRIKFKSNDDDDYRGTLSVAAVGDLNWWNYWNGSETSIPWQEMNTIIWYGGARFWFYSNGASTSYNDLNVNFFIKQVIIYGAEVVPQHTSEDEYPQRVLFGLQSEDYSWLQSADAQVLFMGVPSFSYYLSNGDYQVAAGAAGTGGVCMSMNIFTAYVCALGKNTSRYKRDQIFAHETGHHFGANHASDGGPMVKYVGGDVVFGPTAMSSFDTKIPAQGEFTIPPSSSDCLFNE